MARAPMKLHLKKNQLHKDVGKAPDAKITEADIAKEKSKGGVYAKRAQVRRECQEVESSWQGPTIAEGFVRCAAIKSCDQVECWRMVQRRPLELGTVVTWPRASYRSQTGWG